MREGGQDKALFVALCYRTALRAIAKLLSAFNEIKNKDSALLAYCAETLKKKMREKQEGKKRKKDQEKNIFKNSREHGCNYGGKILFANTRSKVDEHSYRYL